MTTTWGGWFRPTKKTPWVKQAEASTYDDCWAALFDATVNLKGGDLLVSQQDPNRGGVGNLTPRPIRSHPAIGRRKF
jgi:hypothetical protein